MRRPSLCAILLILATGCPKDAPVEPAVGGVVGGQLAQAVAPEAIPEPPPSGVSLGSEVSPEHQALIEQIEQGGSAVTLVDAGAEPRQALRIGAQAGHKEVVRLEMGMTMTMSMGALGSHTASMPTIISDMAMEVTEVTPDDLLVVSTETTFAGVGEDAAGSDPALVAQLEASLAGIEGMKVFSTMDRQGNSVESDLELPASMDEATRAQVDSMNNSLSQVTAPFPSDPVGVGAQWDSAMVVENQGMKILQIVHYQLEDLADDTATFTYDYEQVLVGMGTMDNLPPGAGVEILDFASSGTGRSVHVLADLTPESVEAELALDMLMKITVQGSSQEMRTIMDIDMGLAHVE
jgi:hypothetical protein